MASKTVLVIDADNETEEVIASTLEAEGYLVFAVPGGDMGAEMAQKVKPSLIFVSPEDTSESGMKVCQTIRSYDSMSNVPIILIGPPPKGSDLSSYGIVDSVSLPLRSAELLEKTGKAIDAKAPVVLRVKEKKNAAFGAEKTTAEKPSFEAPREVNTGKSRVSDWAEIPGIDEGPEETRPGPQKDWEKDASFMTGEDGGRKSKKLLLALLAILVIVVGAAAAVYFSGLIPGLGPGAKVPPVQVSQKQKTLPPPPSGLPQTQPPAAGKPIPAPAAVQTPPAAPAPKTPVATVPAAKTPVEKTAAAKKPSAQAVYSVQVGAFKSEENAAVLEKKMKGKGYDAFILKSATPGKGTVYKVLAGRFDNRKKAGAMAAKIRKEEKIKGVIFSE